MLDCIRSDDRIQSLGYDEMRLINLLYRVERFDLA